MSCVQHYYSAQNALLMTDNLRSFSGRIRDDIEKEDAFHGLCAMVVLSFNIASLVQITMTEYC